MKRRALVAIAFALVAVFVVETGTAWARAGSGGSRGSRSYSAPARRSPAAPTTPTSPSRSLTQPAPAPMAPQRPSFFGGLMGGIAGFALGGLLGSMLFGGMGQGFGSGFGLMELLLIGGGLFLLISFLRRRREPQPAYARAGAPASAYDTGVARDWTPADAATATAEAPAATADLERGVGHIRQMDPAFDPAGFPIVARNVFFDVQAALRTRDMSGLRPEVTSEMFLTLQQQCDQLRSSGRTNHVEKIQFRSAEVTEAWQEAGQDFVTVGLAGSLLDYTVDDATGNVVDGSKTAPQELEEFWTFTRPVGPNAWKLSAIQTS